MKDAAQSGRRLVAGLFKESERPMGYRRVFMIQVHWPVRLTSKGLSPELRVKFPFKHLMGWGEICTGGSMLHK